MLNLFQHLPYEIPKQVRDDIGARDGWRTQVKKGKKEMHYIMFLLALLFTNVTNAMNCQELPDCEELGYSKEDVKGCAENGYLNCPFDQDYKVCVQYNCEALGFTDSDKTSWCADLIKCRGNEKMTLCQKPCFATDAQSLTELATTGKCKVVTMRNNISMTDVSNFWVYGHTTIDGANHTLTIPGTKKFYLTSQTKLQNLSLVTKGEGMESVTLINANSGNEAEVNNLTITEQLNNHNASIFSGEGVLTLSGNMQFTLNGYQMAYVAKDLRFKDAQVTISTLKDLIGDSTVLVEDSTLNITATSGVLMKRSHLKLQHAELTLSTPSFVFYGNVDNAESTLTVGEGSRVVLDAKSGVNMDGKKVTFILKGTSAAPAYLEIKKLGGANIYVTAQNTTDTLVLESKTYHPTNPATTLLSEVENSQNWTQAQ